MNDEKDLKLRIVSKVQSQTSNNNENTFKLYHVNPRYAVNCVLCLASGCVCALWDVIGVVMTDNSTRMWWRGTLLGGEGSLKSGWRVKGEERSGVEPTTAIRPGGRSRVWVSLQKQSFKMYSWQRDKTELETRWGINWDLVGIYGGLKVVKAIQILYFIIKFGSRRWL